jgi:1-acyl-sn-glycerol-3-phosphate acyltransferase
MRPLFRASFWILGPIRVRGAYRMPKSGGVLVLSNHLSDVDPPALQVASPRVIRFMGKQELFEMPVLGTILRWFGVFAVKRGEPDRSALKFAVELIRSGQVVGVFPEGQISEDAELQELKHGVALIARQTECPVICVGLRGTQYVVPYGQMLPRPSFRTVHIAWGEVRQFTKKDSTETIMAWVESELRSLTEA